MREGWAYHVSRWPLLVSFGFFFSCDLLDLTSLACFAYTSQGLIFTVIFLEFLGYLIVRQLVNVIEYVSACESSWTLAEAVGMLRLVANTTHPSAFPPLAQGEATVANYGSL